MKKKIAWVTDSTAHITEKLQHHPDVYVVPMSIIFGEDIYEDGLTVTPDNLYTKINEYPELPTTSQPPIGKFVTLYEELKEQYEQIIMIHVSSLISGTYAGSRQAAEMVGIKYHAIDSKAMSYAMTYMLEDGLQLHEEGKTVEEIVAYIEEMVPALEDYILLGSLKQMYKGGRMNGMQFFLGTMLNVRPIITVKEGVFQMFDKVRTEKRAMQRLMDQFAAAYEKVAISRLAILHGNRLQDAQKWKELLAEKYPSVAIDVCPVSSTIGVHAGEGTLAMIWFNR
jgi:DegV family protein with EDD domain